MSGPLYKCVSLGGWSNVLPNQSSNYRASLPGAGTPWTVPNENGPVDPNTRKFSQESSFTMVQELADLGVTHVKFWVSWKELAEAIEEAPSDRHPYALGRLPQTFEEQAQFMDTTKGHSLWIGDDKPLIHYLDESIKEANNNGLKVILTMYQSAPSWSREDENPPFLSGKSIYQKFPDQLTADSPYGWFIRYLVARYTGDQTGGPGCGCIPAIGNPSGARINFIEPINEPNFEWWPQDLVDDVNRIPIAYCKAAEAMTTCEWWCRFYSIDYDPDFNPTILDGHWSNVVTVLGPAGADRTNESYPPTNTPVTRLNTAWDEFTENVLAQLSQWAPVMRVGWAHHNYNDIEEERPFLVAEDPRVYALADLLTQYGFLDNAFWPASPTTAAWRREIWLTEGTYRMDFGTADNADTDDYGDLDGLFDDVPIENQPRGQRQVRQSRAITRNFNLMRDTTDADAVLWTQHIICSDPDEAPGEYGLREDMRRGTIQGPGRRRLSWFAFRDAVP